jgi:large subunit ribosomal protein L7A
MLVAGLTQSKKLIKIGMASSAFIAKDADDKIITLIADLCRACGVPCDKTKTKKELGLMCGIDVDCAVCVTLRS